VTEEKQVTYKMFLPETLRARFKSICALKQVSMNQVLIDLVENWIKENEARLTTTDKRKGAA
jgi:ParG